jgi:hypothetical protein
VRRENRSLVRHVTRLKFDTIQSEIKLFAVGRTFWDFQSEGGRLKGLSPEIDKIGGGGGL